MSPSFIKALQSLPSQSEILLKGDERMTPYLEDVVLKGDPDAVVRARDLQDIQNILEYCHYHKIPVTFAGGQTSLTGSSVALNGLLIATQKMDHILDISFDHQRKTTMARVEPGIVLGEFQRAVADQGLYYPPDPTSRFEAFLGSTVATNATGEDTFLYGATRHYIDHLKVILATGKILELHRPHGSRGDPCKNLGGYSLKKDPIDHFIGSEGTLGFIAEIGVHLLPASPEWFAGIAFFPHLQAALECVVQLLKNPAISPRALELLDHASLDIIKKTQSVPHLPNEEVTAIYFKQEFDDSKNSASFMESWYHLFEEILKKHHAPHLLEAIIIADHPKQKEEIRQWRHAIPSWINETLRQYYPDGGGKVSSDWWVPPEHIISMMTEVAEDNRALKIPTVCFGHIGNGHPHINYITHNKKEKEKAKTLVRRHARKAVKRGGGVAGEHGLGKIYRDMLSVQYNSQTIQEMKDLKKYYDPHWILGQGNIF